MSRNFTCSGGHLLIGLGLVSSVVTFYLAQFLKTNPKTIQFVQSTELTHLEKHEDYQSSTPTDISTVTLSKAVLPDQTTSVNTAKKKYIVYVCDDTRYCYGLGDRQRAIVGVYFLAEVTNRTFGMIMTSPTNITTFYRPNLVNWDIPKSELEGLSSIEIEALGLRTNLGLDEIIFENVFPQDVVYIRTNRKLQNSLAKNKFYQRRFPKWSSSGYKKIFQEGWLRLMTPTDFLRKSLNEALAPIAQAMMDDYRVWEILKNKSCCDSFPESTSKKNNSICRNSSCIDSMNKRCCTLQNANKTGKPTGEVCKNWSCAPSDSFSSTCMSCKKNKTTSNTTSCANSSCAENLENRFISHIVRKCSNYVKTKVKKKGEFSRLKPFVDNFCNVPYPRRKPNITVEQIHKLTGYDQVDLNLVCVHIRLGRSSLLPFEAVRNNASDVQAVWDFLMPYVAKGYHIFLATDAEEIREEGIKVFGDRLHMSTSEIVHIAFVQKGQDKVEGMRYSTTYPQHQIHNDVGSSFMCRCASVSGKEG